MFEVTTKDALKKALLHNEDEIFIINNKLSQGILERSNKYRFIRHAMRINGYEIIKVKTFGAFDIKLVRNSILLETTSDK